MKKRNILSSKTFLYLTEFFAGMSVMAVELGASRLLAPYFSSSQIVWTIIIGTIMIAMALGNIYGGRAADKNPDPDRLYRRILIAAVWIAAIPVLGKYVILGISGLLIITISTNLLIWAALFACLVIFVFPLFLLGTVTPSLIKYSVDSLENSGSIAGRLGAFNTIGSIIGTFVPTFVTIPAVGTSVTFLIFSGILLVLGIVYFLSPAAKDESGGRSGGNTLPSGKPVRGRRLLAVSLTAFLLCSVFGHSDSFAFWEDDLTYEGESVYNYLQVKEDDRSVALSTNVLFGVQSILIKNGALTGMYYDYAMASLYMADVQKKEPFRILVLGNGTGTFATQCGRYFDNLEIEGVEIDGKIIDLADRYFEQTSDITVTEYDGRAYLNAVNQKYDVIMVDAFRDITIPFQMSSVEFFAEVRDHLTDDGVMVVNLNMRGDEPGDINHYLADTISSVFEEVYTADVPNTTNRELFASNRVQIEGAPEISIADALREGIAAEKNEDLRALMQTIADTLVPYEAGSLVMTDDKAPVEMLGIRQIDLIIQDEIGYYKEQIKSGNFSF
ncbi:MAG: fused MFS/spermidine synthase [Eubacterium sp.]|nr:fused MFS/spermidine synthase [Eubacterium sp.]